MLIKLAESRYNRNDLFQKLIGDHSKITTSDSGGVTTIDVSKPTPDNTTLVIPTGSQPSYIDQLKTGKVDYIFTYRSNAVQNGFSYLTLPARDRPLGPGAGRPTTRRSR